MKLNKNYLAIIALLISCTSIQAQTKKWQPLLDKNLSSWEKYIGVPHFTVKGIDDAPKGNGMKGTPLGLNNDPLNVFSTFEENGTTILKVSGEIYGGLTSKEIYEDYHLKLEFKWGETKWEPRLDKQRDNGLLYHCTGEHGAFWNVWMKSQEMQIQELDMGDYYGLAGGVNSIKATKKENEKPIYDKNGEENVRITLCRRQENFEKPNGEWNVLELVCLKGKSYHIVNGHVVMVLNNAENKTPNGFEKVTKGKIQLQSEGAEAYYRNIEIKKIKKLPKFLRKL